MRKSSELTLKTKISISFLLAQSLSLIARINASRLLAEIKDIWSDEEQRSLRGNYSLVASCRPSGCYVTLPARYRGHSALIIGRHQP